MVYTLYNSSFWGYLKGNFLYRVNERYTKAPHAIFTAYLQDDIPEQREKGLKMGLALLRRCDEMWVCGDENTPVKSEIAEELVNRQEQDLEAMP